MSSWFAGPFPAPPMPDETPLAEASLRLRWEDVAQDGRLMLTALAPAIDYTIWNGLLKEHPGVLAGQRQGVVAILSRLIAEGTDEPIRVIEPVTGRGTYQLAHSARDGAVDRLFLCAWVEMRGTRGLVWKPQPPQPPVSGGRMFVEHTFTRLFAPPDQRKLTSFAIPGLPEVPPAVYGAPPPSTAMEVPDDAEPLDAAYVPDAAEICFGLEHTDSNQHVNSLVYPRLFAEAALRRLAARGESRAVLVRALDIAYRKPCFAGDRVRVHQRLFRHRGRLGAAGYLGVDGEARPRVCCRILLA